MKTAGLVLDYYDDPTKEVLKTVFPTLGDIPDIVKTAHPLSPEEREVLRDEAFGLILVNEGKTLRKFACVDEGNTLLSALYFMKTAHKLPSEARDAARANILDAVERFGLMPHVKVASRNSLGRTRDPKKQPQADSEADWSQRTNLNSPTQGTHSAGQVMDTASTLKTASRRVDVTGLSPERQVKQKTASRMALGRYPLDSYADVQKAVSYFSDHYIEMDPPDRHEYAVKTAARADELDIPTTPLLDRYGSTEYAPDVDGHILGRRSIVHDPEIKAAYTELREKRASVAPDQFVQELSELDERAGLHWYYGGEVSDPFLATFGGRGLEKKAGWTWQSPITGDHVNSEQLKTFALSGREALERTLSQDAIDGFQKNPIQVFESMPDPMKLILCRMANDAVGSLVQV